MNQRKFSKLLLITLTIFICSNIFAGSIENPPLFDRQAFYLVGNAGGAFFASGFTHLIGQNGPISNLDFTNDLSYQSNQDLNFISELGIGWNINRYYRTDFTWTSALERIYIDAANFFITAFQYSRGQTNIYLWNNYFNFAPLFHMTIPLQLYIGTGMGLADNRLANLDLTVPINIIPTNFFVQITGAKRQNFAWRVMLGTAYAITPHLLFNLTYSYLDAGKFDSGLEQNTSPGLSQHPMFNIIINEITGGLIILF